MKLISAVLRTALTLCPPPARIADLGCLEGAYAIKFAQAGYDVLGVEVRASNIAKCHDAQLSLGLPNLTFLQDDVRNFDEQYGQFDVIFCSGLLYHLDKPVEFLQRIGPMTRKVLLLHTHYAESQPNPNYPALTDLGENEGLTGRWYPEAPPKGWTASTMEAAVWSSWNNTKSFWLLKRHLLKAIQDSGFAIVCEQFDALDDIAEDPYIEDHSRSLFVGIKVDSHA